MENYKKIGWSAVIIAALIFIVVVYIFFIQKKEGDVKVSKIPPKKIIKAQDTVKEEKKEFIEEEKPPVLTYPLITAELNKSDDEVKDILKDVSGHFLLQKLFAQKGLIRIFVASVDNIAQGKSPRANLPFFDLTSPFQVVKKGKTIWIDPKSYNRYNDMVNLFFSIDSKRVLALYNSAELLINQAYKELGYTDTDFKDTLLQAAKQIIAIPLRKGKIFLEEKVTTYEYLDPQIEKLNDFSRQFLRIGPDNMAKVKKKTKELISLIWNKEEK